MKRRTLNLSLMAPMISSLIAFTATAQAQTARRPGAGPAPLRTPRTAAASGTR